MKVASVQRLQLNNFIPLYDIQNVERNHNFIIRGKKADYVSHNCGIMDEINFQSGPSNAKMSANSMMRTYRAVKMRMKSRFISSGRPLPTLLWMISSKKSENDFLEQYAKEVKGNPDTYIVDEPIWNVKPKGTYCGKTFKVAVGNKFLSSKVIKDDEDPLMYQKQNFKVIDVPIEYKTDFIKDVDGALMDIAGISSSSTLKYLSVERMRETTLKNKNPFSTDILVIGTHDKLQIRDFFDAEAVPEKDYSKPIYIHIDTSQSGDKTGIVAVAIEGAKKLSDDPDAVPELYYKMLFGVDIQNPSSDTQIDFSKNRQFIYYLKSLGWNIKCVSTDGFQSTDTQQEIAKHNINAKLLSLDRSPIGYELLKGAINEKRIGILKIDLLEKEAAEVERDSASGKIDHPKNGSKDMLDALAGALWSASLDKKSYLFDHGEDIGLALEINMQPADDKMRAMQDLHKMLEQDTHTAKEDVKKVLNRAQERKAINVTNMSKAEKETYSRAAFEEEYEDIFTPTHLNDSIVVL